MENYQSKPKPKGIVKAKAVVGNTEPRADVNYDGKVTVEDANAIIYHVLGNEKL